MALIYEFTPNTKEKAIDKNGYPIPRSEICFRCSKNFWLTFVFSKQNYSLKNSWFYYTEKKEDKNKFICSPCLRNVYLEDKKFYLENIKDIKKKRLLSSYISTNSI